MTVKFLIRKGVVKSLDRIIEEADRELIIISASMKPNDDTKRLLEKAKPKEIHVVYGKWELKPSERNFFTSIGITPIFRKDLHAKCYLNEKEALITSMNLYDYSQKNNDEMGILVTKRKDKQLYDAIYSQAVRWKDAPDETSISTAQKSRQNTKPKSTGRKTRTKPTATKARPGATQGFCIRCQTDVPFAPENPKPYCYNCYATWNAFQNPEYEEKFCHACGKQQTTSMLKPLCRSCYRKYKSVFQPIAYVDSDDLPF